MTLGDFLYDVRETKLKIGVRALARKIGKSPSYISNIENDNRIPEKEETLRLLAEAYEVDYDQLRILSSNTVYFKKTEEIESLQLSVARTVMKSELSESELIKIKNFLERKEDYIIE